MIRKTNMFKTIKKNFRKIYSLFTAFLMLSQNIIPAVLAVQPIYAAEQTVVSNVSLDFDSDSHELVLSGETNQETNYLLSYDDDNEETPKGAVTGSVSATEFEQRVFVGTCSAEDCVEEVVTHGQVEFPEANYLADYQINNDVLWLTRDEVSTVSEVELNKTYFAPQNNQVTVTFTSLPEQAGSLSIEEIQLTDEQVEQLGAFSNTAYDITSTMEDGTFEYDLTLPLPEGADDTAKVVYTESVDQLDDVKELEKTVEGNQVKAEGVDHFTVFVVTFNSIPVVFPGSFPSLGYQATSTQEFGDHFLLDGTERKLDSLTISLTNWACESNSPCTTTPGSSFNHPITLNIYNVDKSGVDPAVGTLITTKTLNADIPYRPSADDTMCTGDNTGKWYDTVSGKCQNGYAFNLDYDFSADGILLPDEVIVTVAYNTQTHGYEPIGVAGPYNSLNVSLTTAGTLTGTDVEEGSLFWNTKISSWYTDGGAGGSNILRRDTNWFDDFGAPYTLVMNMEMAANSAPEVNIEDPTPAADTYVKGTVTGRAVATDDNGMGSYYLRFWKDAFEVAGGGTLVKGCQSAPGGSALGKSQDVSCELDSTQFPDGKYFFSAQFLDSDIKWGMDKREFNVDNTVPIATIDGIAPVSSYNSASQLKVHAIDDNYLQTDFYRSGEATPFKTYTGAWFGISWLPDNDYKMVVIDKAGNSTEYNFTIDKTFPEMSDITMFVNEVETSLSKPGDEVKVQALVTDVSGIDKVQIWVREYPWSPNNNQLIAGEMTLISGDLWEYVFTIPGTYQDGDSLNQEIDGNYFNFRPYDNIGNSHIGWRQNFTIDATRPTGQIVTPVNGTILGDSTSTITVSGNVADYSTGIREVQVRLRNYPGNTFRTDWVNATVDGSGNYSVDIDISTLPADDYEVAVVAYDMVDNNKWLWTRPVIEIDRTAPVTTLTSPTDNSETNQSITIEGSSTDENTVAEVNLYYSVAGENNWQLITTLTNGSNDEPFNFSYEWNPSEEGTFDIKVSGTDSVGNVENSAYAYGIVYDLTAPAAPKWGTIYKGHGIDSSNEISCGGYTNNTKVTFEWEENTEDDLKGYWFGTKFNEKHQWFDAGSTVKTANMTTGNNPYYYTVIAVDNAGNESSISEQCGLTLDQEDPSSVITSYGLADGEEVETSEFPGLIEGTATDVTSGVDHVLLSISHLGFGEDESARKYWDATSSAWIATDSLFRATGTDTWAYQLPEAGIIEGFYTITSHAVDMAGNVEDTYTIKIVYDKTIPEVELTIDPSSPDGERGWYRFINPTITLAASDNYDLDHIEYQWNSTSGTWTTYSTPFNLPGEGQNILYYRSVDKVGNVSDLGVKEVKLDGTNPAGAPLNVKVSNITSNTADAEWEAPDPDDDVSYYRLSWKHEDGTVHGVETGFDDFNHQLDQLYDGEWTLYVKAMDEAGNFTEATTKFRVGPGSSSGGNDQGDVLGVTTDGTGVGGANFAQTSVLGTTSTSEENGDSEESGEIATVSDDGEVLGADTCSGLINYLPLLVLLALVIAMVLFELLFVGSPISKVIGSVVIVAISVVIYFYFRDEQCRPDQGLMKMMDSWFVIFSIVVALISKVITQVLFKGE